MKNGEIISKYLCKVALNIFRHNRKCQPSSLMTQVYKYVDNTNKQVCIKNSF